MIPFHLALWSTLNNPAQRLVAGQIADVGRMSSVGATLDEALKACAGWPVHVYEAEAAPDDDTAQGDAVAPLALATRARIVRALSHEEVFGPRAAGLDIFLSELPSCTWLTPVGPPDMARLSELANEHYRALAEFAPVELAPLSLVSDWRQAHWQQRESILPSVSGYSDALELFLSEQKRRAKIAVRRVAQMSVYHATYLTAWEAAWRVASADRLQSKEVLNADVQLVRRRLEQVREEFLAAIEQRGKGAWETAAWLSGLQALSGGRPGAPNDGLPPDSLLRRVLATPSEELLQSVWIEVFGAANSVLNRAADVAADILNPPEKPNPTAPLYEMTRLGYWPLGEVGGRFLVFASPTPAT